MPLRHCRRAGSGPGKYPVELLEPLEKQLGQRVTVDSGVGQSDSVVGIDRSLGQWDIDSLGPYFKPFGFEFFPHPGHAGQRHDKVTNSAWLDPKKPHES